MRVCDVLVQHLSECIDGGPVTIVLGQIVQFLWVIQMIVQLAPLFTILSPLGVAKPFGADTVSLSILCQRGVARFDICIAQHGCQADSFDVVRSIKVSQVRKRGIEVHHFNRSAGRLTRFSDTRTRYD